MFLIQREGTGTQGMPRLGSGPLTSSGVERFRHSWAYLHAVQNDLRAPRTSESLDCRCELLFVEALSRCSLDMHPPDDTLTVDKELAKQ
jgi:hypothetical protein